MRAMLRGSGHEGHSAFLLHIRGRLHEILVLHIGLFPVGILDELEKFPDLRFIPIPCRVVRFHEHPFPKHVLRILPAHPLGKLPPNAGVAAHFSDRGLVAFQKVQELGARLVVQLLVECSIQVRKRSFQIVFRHHCLHRLRQVSPEDCVVHARVPQEWLQLLEQDPRRISKLVGFRKSELAPPHIVDGFHKRGLRFLEMLLQIQLPVFIKERRKRGNEGVKVRIACIRLHHEAEVAAAPCPLGEEGIVLLDPPKGAIVHGASAHQAVVRIKVPLREADAQPPRHHSTELLGEGINEVKHPVLKRRRVLLRAQLGILAEKRVLDDLLELQHALRRGVLLRDASAEQIDVSHAQEGRRNAAGDRRRL
mmetsp:Transcript_266/g.1101  ORF Transcript_266/g.1101 Transcript_266/m.1101 type:complete len:365 (+) Transcript_266:283-1377(+)